MGTAVANSEQLTCENPYRQKSFRKTLLDGLRGSSGAKSNVEYVDIRKCSATDIFEIERIINMIERKYNPRLSNREWVPHPLSGCRGRPN